MSRSKRARPKDVVLGVLFTVILLAAVTFLTEFKPLNDLDTAFHEVIGRLPWLLPVVIALTVVGGLLLVGAQFLPEPRRKSSLSDAALDGSAAPMDYREARGRFTRSFEASVTMAQVREAWRRRSWRYSRQWRVFFVMMLGALLMTVGMIGLLFILGPLWLALLAAGVVFFFGLRLGWALWIGA